MSTSVDARAMNWRFVTPGKAPGMLYLPVVDETVEGAVVPHRSAAALDSALGQAYPAVAVPDLTAWARLCEGDGATGLLRRLAAALRSGGWFYVGVANRGYPPHLGSEGAVSLRGATRTLRDAGLFVAHSYAALPDQRAPAYLVSLETAAELRHFLRLMSFPFVDPNVRRPRLRQRTLRVLRRVALATPHRVRVAVVPAFALVGRKA